MAANWQMVAKQNLSFGKKYSFGVVPKVAQHLRMRYSMEQ